MMSAATLGAAFRAVALFACLTGSAATLGAAPAAAQTYPNPMGMATGATAPRTFGNRAGDHRSPADFLTSVQTEAQLTTAAFDAAPAINAALGAGLSVDLPCGTYAINSPITGMTKDGTSLSGAPGCVVFNIGFSTGDVIRLSGTHFQTVQNIRFNATVAHTSGAGIHQLQTSNNSMDKLTFYGLWNADAMLLDGSNTTFINDFDCSNGPLFAASAILTGGACLHVIGNALEVHVKHGLSARFDAGLRITYGSGVYVESLDAVQNIRGVVIDPAVGQAVFGIQMTNVLSDTSYGDNWFFSGAGPISDVQLANCWASSSGTSAGMLLNNPALDNLQIGNTVFTGNHGDGLNIAAGKNIVITGSTAEHNNITGAVGGSGFRIQAGVSQVTISGSKAGEGGTYAAQGTPPNHQSSGIFVEAGAGNYLSFTGNNLLGNIASSMAINATGAQIKTAGNVGFTEVNGGATTLPSGQGSMTISTGVQAPDARIIFMFSPLSSYASCGVTGLSSSFVTNNVVTITASNVPTGPCQFWWRASAWGN